jgi:hypothetical protein
MAIAREWLQLITITNGVPSPGTVILHRSGGGQVQWASADYAYVLIFVEWPFREPQPAGNIIQVPAKGLTERYGIKAGSGELNFSYSITTTSTLDPTAPPLGPIIVGDD